MSLAENFMNAGTIVLMLASLPQLKSIWENRNELRGYSPTATLFLFSGLSLITISFIMLRMWVSVAAQVIPLCMWAMATYYSRKS
jgi:uncharacterized protein with PQ loop repeat